VTSDEPEVPGKEVLECISSMVDFSMGTINLMVGYMTSGHGPLHVLRPDDQLTTLLVGADEEVGESARTQVRARGGILPKAPGRSRARPSWYTGVGAGIKQPPSGDLDAPSFPLFFVWR
jgi:hypothetical protein